MTKTANVKTDLAGEATENEAAATQVAVPVPGDVVKNEASQEQPTIKVENEL